MVKIYVISKPADCQKIDDSIGCDSSGIIKAEEEETKTFKDLFDDSSSDDSDANEDLEKEESKMHASLPPPPSKKILSPPPENQPMAKRSTIAQVGSILRKVQRVVSGRGNEEATTKNNLSIRKFGNQLTI